LIAISRANPAFRGSDPGMVSTQFALLIQQAVVGQNQVRAVANQQIPANCDTKFAQAFDLANQCDRIDHDSVSNYANFAAPENSRRDQVENVFKAMMENGMPGVIAALATNNNISLGRKDVDNLALTFVAPLRSN